MSRLRRRARVLHLAYEDPVHPGAGGGSVRTAEINARLADQFDLVVVSAPFTGCRARSADGVRYLHAGMTGPRTVNIMSYFAALPLVIAQLRPELVVEDFGAPLSTYGLPRLTRRPVVGVVQWLFARQKSREYRLPLHRIEAFGVRQHETLIAVSDDLAGELRRMNPVARVSVVPNGLPDAAFSIADGQVPSAGDVRFLGRLEDAQKGIGLLLRAFARVADRIPQRLTIGGDGPDRMRLEREAAELGIAGRVDFVGAIAAPQRFEWLAAADVVAMPSRYETFGMVAAEALAVGRPVLAFDIDCLRGLVSERTGRAVVPFDVDRYGLALIELCTDPALRARLSEAARRSVRGLSWDAAAKAQAAVYDAALCRGGNSAAR